MIFRDSKIFLFCLRGDRCTPKLSASVTLSDFTSAIIGKKSKYRYTKEREGERKVGMTKRQQAIYEFMLEQLRLNGESQVFTTQEIAEWLSLQRSNVSKDLNEFVRKGEMIKLAGRPVRYQLLDVSFEKATVSVRHSPHHLTQPKKSEGRPNSDVFAQLIGNQSSLKNAVEQAKAAVLYPPKGLHCLITGPTGSGKTHFAHSMFQYAQENQIIALNKKLVVFNCADYAHSPELLMSHLFGYVKGAFTGADSERKGLIDEADESLLFLDEIHRLPPEGQEMIFYLMDYGTYGRLGELGKNRQANVRIVGATTENTNSALLDTFLRRIPIHIQLPAFEQRTTEEKIDFIQLMIAQEATRINRRISLTEDVVKALIGSVSFGNIGQLKSSVQLACARGFLNHLNQSQIDLTLADLPDGIQNSLRPFSNNREAAIEFSRYLSSGLIVEPGQEFSARYSDSYELPYNLYEIIGDKATLLKEEGVSQAEINDFITRDIHVHLQSFYKDHGFSFSAESKLSEFVDPKVVELTRVIYERIKGHLPEGVSRNFLYAMSLHISSFLKKQAINEQRNLNPNIRRMVADYPLEFEQALVMKEQISSYFAIAVPEEEVYYLAALLISLSRNPMKGRVGLVIAAHGKSTASSMAEVARQLLGTDYPLAVDMPLEMSPKIAYGKIKEAIIQSNQGFGVLLLVDMGSLTSFGERVYQETGIVVETLDMVTTPIVLEGTRKAETLGTTLMDLVHTLKAFQGYHAFQTEENERQILEKPSAILAICASGQGTAQKIKEMLEAALMKKNLTQLLIVTESVVDVEKKLPLLQKKYNFLATTGIMDPGIQAPYISLEKLLQSDLDQLLEEIILGDFEENHERPVLGAEEFKKLCQNEMEKTVMFLNPTKAFEPLWQMSHDLLEAWPLSKNSSAFQMNFVLHLTGVIERCLLNQSLIGGVEEETFVANHPRKERLAKHLLVLETTFHLKISVIERYYLLKMLEQQENTQKIH